MNMADYANQLLGGIAATTTTEPTVTFNDFAMDQVERLGTSRAALHTILIFSKAALIMPNKDSLIQEMERIRDFAEKAYDDTQPK